MTDLFTRLVDRFSRRSVTLAAIVAALVVVVGGYAVYQSLQEDRYTITAQFVSTPGLYADNNVDILGIPTGKIVSISPKPHYVEVKLDLPAHVKIPANAQAVVMAPNPVSDRFVELYPPYTEGPVLKGGATIPLSRTIVPLELDDVFRSVAEFSTALGPDGANKDGALSDVLHAFAKLANGQGADLHTAITRIAAALPALTAHPDQLAKLINGLNTLTTTLAARDSTINSLYNDLAGATTELAGERQTIAVAVANLQSGLQQVSTFIKTNQDSIGASVRDLTTTVSTIMSEQKALIQTFDVAPLGFQNFNRSIQPNGPCATATGAPADCPSVYARLTFGRNNASMQNAYCGDVAVNVLDVIAYSSPVKLNAGTIRNGDTLDLFCAVQAAIIDHRPGAPGAPNVPDLGLSKYLGN